MRRTALLPVVPAPEILGAELGTDDASHEGGGVIVEVLSHDVRVFSVHPLGGTKLRRPFRCTTPIVVAGHVTQQIIPVVIGAAEREEQAGTVEPVNDGI